jgi:hypothetical protein
MITLWLEHSYSRATVWILPGFAGDYPYLVSICAADKPYFSDTAYPSFSPGDNARIHQKKL